MNRQPRNPRPLVEFVNQRGTDMRSMRDRDPGVWTPKGRQALQITVSISVLYVSADSFHTYCSTRQRERQMRGLRSPGQAQHFLSVHGAIGNLFRVGRHLVSSANHRTLRDRSFEVWREVTCAC